MVKPTQGENLQKTYPWRIHT